MIFIFLPPLEGMIGRDLSSKILAMLCETKQEEVS